MSVDIVALVKKAETFWDSSKLVGCSEADLQEAMQQQNVSSLPLVYRDVMLYMGKEGIANFLDGECSCKYIKEPSMKGNLLSQLPLEGLSAPDSIFVFFNHHGYIYYWFDTADANDDPPVYGWGPDPEEITKLAESISEFLYERLDKFYHFSWKTGQ